MSFWIAKPPSVLPKLAALFGQLLDLCASSAQAERMFSSHSTIHTENRAALGEKGAEAQRLRGLLALEGKHSVPKEVENITHEALHRLAVLVRMGWALENMRKLTAGTKVQVWMEASHTYGSRNRIRPYDAVVLRQLAATEQTDNQPAFKVTWESDKKSTQLFKPLVDEWTFV